MSNALQDQLLKAGLTTEKKIQKENHAKRKKSKQNKKKKNQRVSVDESKLLVEQANEAKKQKDRELNQAKEDIATQKAISAQIRQLIESNNIDSSNGEIPYNFEEGKKVKKLNVTEDIHRLISNGMYAIAKSGENYHVIPAKVAHKIMDRDPSYVVVQNELNSTSEEIDEHYSQYTIPDDLMW